MPQNLPRWRRGAPPSAAAFTDSPVCPICGSEGSFVETGPWARDDLTCTGCHNGSVPRERAAALALAEYAGPWRESRLLECSPGPRGLSVMLSRECTAYRAINLFPERPIGEVIEGVRNEDLQALSFADASFDVFVGLDVLEHVTDPGRAIDEISRVLTSAGIAVLTFPIRSHLSAATVTRARIREDSTLEHLAEPEWHGDPFSDDGALVFTDFGYDVHRWISERTGRPVRIIRYADEGHGIVGELTDVCVIGPRPARVRTAESPPRLTH